MANEFEALKLFSERDFEEHSANGLARTRANNLIACSALSTYLDTEGEKETKSMQGYGLPTNIENSNESDEYYAALKFFKNNYSYFAKSQAMIKLRDLFSWASNEEYRTVVIDCYIAHKDTKSLMRAIKDIDLRKVAAKFAQNGDYKNGKLLFNKAELEKVDNQVAALFGIWKKDIINYYNQEKKFGDEPQK